MRKNTNKKIKNKISQINRVLEVPIEIAQS